MARGGELAWKTLPLRGSPPLTRFALWAASQECTLDISKARAELGYEPVTSRAERARRAARRLAPHPESSQTTIVASTRPASIVITNPSAPPSEDPE